MQLLDAFTNSFAYVGRRTTGSGATDVAIAGPRWRGRVPRGVRLVRSPTPVVWLLGRTLVDGPADLPAVNALQRGYALRAARRPGRPAAGRAVDPELDAAPRAAAPRAWPSSTRWAPPWRRTRRRAATARCWRGCAASGSAPACAPRAGALGAATRAGPARRGGRRARPAGRLRGPPAARLRAHRTAAGSCRPPASAPPAPTRSCAPRSRAPRWAPTSAPRRSTRRRTPTAAAARSTARHRYALRFAPGQLPPVKAFWSLTMYGADRFLVENPIGRYALGDRTAGLRRDADGGLTILLQHDRAARRPAGQLAARPGGPLPAVAAPLRAAALGARRPLAPAGDHAHGLTARGSRTGRPVG